MVMSPLGARDIRVSSRTGDDRADGLAKPVKTIKRAIALAGPGDTVNLDSDSSPYYEQVWIQNKSGEPGRPITIDGHGSVIEGSGPALPEQFTQVAPGLYKSTYLYTKICHNNDAYMRQFFFLFDGRMNRMNHSSKGGSPPFPKIEDLKPMEWAYVADEKAFYLKLDPGKTFADYNIRMPVMDSGMEIQGPVHDIVIKNLTVKHVNNDGFALNSGYKAGTGFIKENHITNIRYENIEAIDNGDDGFSAHGNCDVYVDGFVAIGNSTGIATGGTGEYHHVYIAETHGIDIALGDGHHVFKDSVIENRIAYPITLHTYAGITEPIRMVMENCLIRRDPALPASPKGAIVIRDGSIFDGRRLTIIGVNVDLNQGRASLADSFVGGGPNFHIDVSPKGIWHGEHNLYDLGGSRMSGDANSTLRTGGWLIPPPEYGAYTVTLPLPHQ